MSTSVWIGVAVLAISTYALRLGGVRVAGRTAHPHAGRTRLVTSAVGALLAALAIGSAVVDDHGSPVSIGSSASPSVYSSRYAARLWSSPSSLRRSPPRHCDSG